MPKILPFKKPTGSWDRDFLNEQQWKAAQGTYRSMDDLPDVTYEFRNDVATMLGQVPKGENDADS
jgi:hypothetical protein